MKPRITSYIATIVLGLCLVEMTLSAESIQDDSAGKAASVPPIDELLLFFPSKYPAGDWSPADLTFEDLWCTADDGVRIHGWFCPCTDPRCTILIMHGNAGNIAFRAPMLRYFQSQLRTAVYMFDYRGYGRSVGTPSVEGILRDARAARRCLADRTKLPESELVLMGESLGGAIAIQLASGSPARGLVLQSTFPSLRDVAAVHYPGLSWLVSPTKLDSLAKVASYRGPLLQSHGTADRTIPLELGTKLFKAANTPKWFFAVEGADHNNWFTPDYQSQLDAFVARLAGERK
jgi:fermentation-respiration switch protein FrsA (DUF1100 family)